ncbi:hypothetical protein JNUCC0626_29165 [Lentzea sp. JNUCC 0626]|uniref:hypothetical protein n=1 Tax=Lentzea sp. JNUCC 0626 TaxID=3367513 RepID=UPI0037484D25
MNLAGLPVHRDEYREIGAGVELDIDLGADDEGGVHVIWKAQPHLREAAVNAVEQGNFDDPAIWRSGEITQIMGDAIFEILRAAGFGVEKPGDNSMRTFSVQVTSSPEGTV